jgi:hypothetical protein
MSVWPPNHKKRTALKTRQGLRRFRNPFEKITPMPSNAEVEEEGRGGRERGKKEERKKERKFPRSRAGVRNSEN